MDGEHDGVADITSLVESDDARDTWARYHLIGDVLRDHSSEIARSGFAAGIAGRVAEEPTVLAPGRERPNLFRPVAGFAIAASVAALAVIGVRQMSPPPGAEPAAIAAAPASVGEAPVVRVADQTPPVLETVEPLPEALHAQRRLNSYLVKFNEQRSNVGVRGVNPYVRIVGFEAE